MNAGTGRPYYDTPSIARTQPAYDPVAPLTAADTGVTGVSPPTATDNSQGDPSSSPCKDEGSALGQQQPQPQLGDGVPPGGLPGDCPAAGERKPLHGKLLTSTAHLEMKELWDEFDHLGTEMIVTKAGR